MFKLYNGSEFLGYAHTAQELYDRIDDITHVVTKYGITLDTTLICAHEESWKADNPREDTEYLSKGSAFLDDEV